MTKVSLRQKKLSTSKISLYLDFYPPIINPKTGKSSRREFLNMYIYSSPKNAIEKQENKETLHTANLIRSNREVQLRNKEFGFKENINLNIDFVNFYKRIVDEYYNKGGKSNYLSWNSSYMHFYKFCNGILMSNNLNTQLISEYKNYLLKAYSLRNSESPKKLSKNTVASYYKNFIYVLKLAYKQNLIKTNLADSAEYIKEEETHREYLTEEELKLLWNTEIKNEKVKHMAIFSALTGLRFVDINLLEWNNIYVDIHQNSYLQIRESKTKNIYNHPISETAINILRLQDTTEVKVFGNIQYSQITRPLKDWLEKSKINKKISFHNFRHTYATLQLANGSDIYTVSKLLGHKNVSTTSIYTKVLDKNKIEAANRIKLNLNGL